MPHEQPIAPTPIAPGVEVRFGAEKFSGPMPHPDHYALYEKVLPGSADRILAMAERQLALSERVVGMGEKQEEHRQALEVIVVREDIRARDRGMTLGFIIAMSGLLIGAAICFVSLLILHSVPGIFVGGGVVGLDLAYLAGTFVYGSQNRRKERATRWGQVLRKDDKDEK